MKDDFLTTPYRDGRIQCQHNKRRTEYLAMIDGERKQCKTLKAAKRWLDLKAHEKSNP